MQGLLLWRQECSHRATILIFLVLYFCQVELPVCLSKGLIVSSSTKTGTLVGTLMSVFATIQTADLLKTAILAAVGATVSFLMSWIWRQLTKSSKQ
jgi:hypothetical protein